MGELMKHGCTTCFDHHYVFPAGRGDLLGAQFAAADELGIRMLCLAAAAWTCRVKDGGLPPDSVVQTVDEILADSAALHRDATTTRAMAPCAAGRAGPVLAVLRLSASCCGRARCWRGSTVCACTRTCARRRTRRTTPLTR